MNQKKSLGIQEATHFLLCEKPAIYRAIKLKRLKFSRDKKNRYLFTENDLQYYLDNKYRRDYRLKDSETSAPYIAKDLGISNENIYSWIYEKKIKSKKRGHHWVIPLSEMPKILELSSKLKEKRLRSENGNISDDSWQSNSMGSTQGIREKVLQSAPY